MPEMSYERINDYATISISLASPNDIRSWSHGEVKTPETINYRTYRPEKDGLFCERIFGPERDWECSCGKFKGIKYKDIICDRCGVKITHSKVRRSRMGHINLAVPVVHIWFFRAMPSRLGTLLGIKSTGLQQVIYFQRYVVLNPGTPPAVLPANLECRKCQVCPERDSCDKASCTRKENFSACAECKACAKAAQTKILKPRDLLNEEENKFVERCSNRCNRQDFVAEMGAEAIRALLRELDLAKEEEELRAELRRRRKSTFSAVKYFIDRGLLKDKDDGKWEEPDTEEELKRFAAANLSGKPDAIDAAVRHIAEEGMAEPTRLKTETLVKRLRLIQALCSRTRQRDTERDPMWMVMDVIPVIPPDLRPLVPLDSGNFATSDLNDLYRRVIYRNNRLAKLLDLNAPSVIVRNEKRMLQQAVDALFDNGRCKRPVQGAGNRPLKSLTDMIKGKQGRFRANLLGKRVDYSARSVIIVGPELRIDQVGLPKKIALELFQPFIIRALKDRGLADTIKSAKTMLERKDSEIWDVLEKVIEGHPVMLNRAPTLHRMGIQAFYPVLVEGDAIRIHPLVCSGFNADFDGDQMAVHLPLTVEAQTEASLLMISAANIFSPAHGNPVITADLDIVLGGYYLTLMRSGIPGGWVFADVADAMAAYEGGQIHLCAPIAVRVPDDWNRIRMKAAGSGAKGMAPGDDSVVERFKPVSDSNVRMFAANEDEMKIFLRGRLARKDALGESAMHLPAIVADGEEWNAAYDKDGPRPFVITTIGRLLFKELLPMKDVLYNYPMNKRSLNRVVSDCHVHGRSATVGFLDDMKEAGFHYATLSGMSFATCDLRTPGSKPEIIARAEDRVALIQEAHMGGDITEGERYYQIVDAWTHVSEEILRDLLVELRGRGEEGRAAMLNPIWAMFDSGARGSTTQIRQLAGFRGLMSKPNGRIIETPIRANFREGLRGLEYFSSTHGARKGLADTALKTADSGYLTRKLVEVAQDVTIAAHDCGTERGVAKGAVMSGEHEEVSLADNVVGRVACDNVVNIYTGEKVVEKGGLITREIAQAIQALDYGKIRVRSPLTCELPFGLCAKCYGMDLSTGRLVEAGTAVGVIAAQSIGEPGTQLTMRTFHIGGIAKHAVTESELRADVGGTVKFHNLRIVETLRRTESGEDAPTHVVLNRNGEIVITDERGREIGEAIPVPAGALLKVKEGDVVRVRQPLATWDAYNTPLLTERGGTVRFEDIIEGKTVRTEVDPSGYERRVIIEHRGEQQPMIVIIDPNGGTVLGQYTVPEKAHLRVDEGDVVIPGQELARTPREVGTTQDITGGLPRVTELFEARRPKDPAVMASVSGVVRFGPRSRQKRIIIIETDAGVDSDPHAVPMGKHIRVQAGDRVRAGEPLSEGPLVPHDILAVNGVEALQNYLLNEIQKVYRSQNVRINDKHIEIITRQMLAKVKIEDSGDTPFLLTDSVSLSTIRRVNEEMLAKGLKPARYVPILQGVARASLSSESVIAAASFQETTRVLTDGALAGRRDNLRGLKENVLIGRMIPAGTGHSALRKAQVRTAAPAVSATDGLATTGHPDSDFESVLDVTPTTPPMNPPASKGE